MGLSRNTSNVVSMDALTSPTKRSVQEARGIHNPYDESTAFGYSHVSAYDETTVALSNQLTSAARGQDNTNTSRIPPQVIVCQVQGIEEF